MKPEIAKQTLILLAKYQGKKIDKKKDEEPGKILHQHYASAWVDKLRAFLKSKNKADRLFKFLFLGFPYYGSIDSTALFLILLSFYYEKTHDKKLVKKLWPNVKKALYWIDKYGNIDNDPFIETARKNKHGLFHQGWKDAMDIYIKPPIAMVEVQGYYYLAFLKIAELAKKIMKDKKLEKKLKKKANKLKHEFNKKFWMEKEQYFALALSGKKKQIKLITSNPGHLLFTGIIDDNRVKKVVKRLFADDLWTNYGIRTESVDSPNFKFDSYHHGAIWPFDNWIIYMGLKKYGFKKEAKMIKNALVGAYSSLDSIPELYMVKDGKALKIDNSCHLQAWSTCALINILLD